jgi:hypothetical protein
MKEHLCCNIPCTLKAFVMDAKGLAKAAAASCLVPRPLGRTLFRSGIPFRSFIERGLEHYAWYLYKDRNFLGTLTAKVPQF